MNTDDTAGPLWIRLFGPFEARVCGQPLPRLRFRKSQMILALLVLRHGREYSRSGGMEREWLAGLLWPESALSAARHNLRNCLTDLRRALGPEAGRLCSSSSRSLCLDLTGASVDVLTFDAALAREPHDPHGGPAALDEAVSVYRGPLLEGWTEEWVFQERQAREQVYLQALEGLGARAVAGGDAATAEQHLRRAVAADPLRERAQRALMQVLAAGGNYAAAIQVYRDLRQRLYREINAEPDAETQALFQQLRAEARRRAARPVTTGPRPEAAPINPPPRRVPARAVPRSSGQGVAARHCPPDGFPGNLPHELTSFIGREDQMAEIQQWLSISRLVTLTGAGGCGKSRLAREVGKGLLALPSAEPGSGPGSTPAEEYADGVWLIELAPLVDPALVPQSVAAPLGVREVPGQPLTQTLIESLKSRHLLLLLDNCEHLIEGCARLAETLLQSCPALRILATSREPLGVSGERPYRVPSLSLPTEVESLELRDESPTKTALPDPSTINHQLSTINQYEAIRLFCERAAGMVPAFALTAENAAAVAQVCRRLDGIPLAIELAAARLKALPVDAIAARLDDMFRLLTGGSRTALPHHQTLRAMIDWSFELLTPAEQVLLRRLSVFAGGCSLEAVEAVCCGFGLEDSPPAIENRKSEIQNVPVFDLLTRLVEKSLVLYEERDGEGRYRLLEMIREYAREQLANSGEADALRERHAGFFLALAETADREREARPSPSGWLDRLEREHGNLRAALAWSVESGELDLGLQLATALNWFWYRRGLFKEALHYLLPMLAQPAAAAPGYPRSGWITRARALLGAGEFMEFQSDRAAARRLYEESLAIGRALGDRAGIATALLQLGWLAANLWDATTARPLVEEGLAIHRELGDPRGIAGALALLADVRRLEGDLAAERALAEESLAIWRALGDRAGIGEQLGNLGEVIARQGDLDTALPLIEEALATAREHNNKVAVAQAINYLGRLARWQEDYPAAQALFEQSLALCRELDHKYGQIECLFHLGFCHQQQGDSAAAYARFEEMLAINRAYGHHGTVAPALIGDAAADLGRWEEAAVRCAGFLRSYDLRERSDRHHIAWALTPLARVALARGRPARAARLLGAAPALWAASHAHWWPNQRADFERIVSAVRAQLGEEEFATAWAEGEATPIEVVIAKALQEAPAG